MPRLNLKTVRKNQVRLGNQDKKLIFRLILN